MVWGIKDALSSSVRARAFLVKPLRAAVPTLFCASGVLRGDLKMQAQPRDSLKFLQN